MTADEIRQVLARSIRTTELQHTQVQLRLVSALLAGLMICTFLLAPALILIFGVDTLVWRVARITTLGPERFGLVMLTLAALLVPYLVLQFGYLSDHRREVVRLAVDALLLTSCAWFFMAYRCVSLDVEFAGVIVFLQYAAGALLFSFALALSLNAEQLRVLLDKGERA